MRAMGRNAMIALAACFASACNPMAQDPKSSEYSQPRRFSGIWLYEFEGSAFIDGATDVPKSPYDYGKVAWLEYAPEQIAPGPAYDDYAESGNCYPIHSFAITFIGREKASSGGSGHMGIFGSEIVVDQLVSARSLGQPFCYKRD